MSSAVGVGHEPVGNMPLCDDARPNREGHSTWRRAAPVPQPTSMMTASGEISRASTPRSAISHRPSAETTTYSLNMGSGGGVLAGRPGHAASRGRRALRDRLEQGRAGSRSAYVYSSKRSTRASKAGTDTGSTTGSPVLTSGVTSPSIKA